MNLPRASKVYFVVIWKKIMKGQLIIQRWAFAIFSATEEVFTGYKKILWPVCCIVLLQILINFTKADMGLDLRLRLVLVFNTLAPGWIRVFSEKKTPKWTWFCAGITGFLYGLWTWSKRQKTQQVF